MFDIIIVGAGISGLTTAYKLLQREPSLKLKILEASHTIGGQIAPAPTGEMVGRCISENEYHIYNLLTELKIPLRRRSPVSKNLQRSWAIDKGYFAIIVNYELKRYMDSLDLKAQLFRPGTYTLTPEDQEYTMCHHIRQHMFFTDSREFMMNMVRLVAGADAKDISYVGFMNILHSCGGLRTLMHLYMEPSPELLEFSPEFLLEALESNLSSVDMSTGAKVTQIQHHHNCVVVRELSGKTHSSRVVVLAIPWNKTVDIFIIPPMPAELEVAIPASKCYITSFVVQYNEAHWRRNGLSGNFYSSNPVPIYAQQYKPNSLSGYVLHEEEDLAAKSVVLCSLSKSFGEEMTVPCCYRQQTFEQISLLNLPQTTPWNRIIWSSTSTATLYRGCLSGAVQSGLRAAVHSLLILCPQSVTWQDVAEVQKANAVYRYPSCWDLLKSSVNVYNTLFYTAVGILIYCLVRDRH